MKKKKNSEKNPGGRGPEMGTRWHPSPRTTTRCAHTAAECAAGASVLCVCCLPALLCCCIKLPVMLAWRTARRLSPACCCGAGGREPGHLLVDASSSFSDIDFDADRQLPKRRAGCPRDDGTSRRRNFSKS